ncbi:3-keto-disaccharide hydrolase [Frigoriglobus tundricola]|uniref:Beta-jelly-roll-type glycoside hydrolase n=1 Tax=Frigoriglobus tundricola TaxID=2774151 RepID=A0A6M5Z0P2_9BACT|nr:DUF1080 domain-containing protein [Frigoriglobus tundricola]QJW99200.1 beta-jelly-roll-type glycoside hydrolase [Frigoriglobus tundricola]
MQFAYLYRTPAVFVVAVTAVIALSSPASRVGADDKKDEGWIALFNGKDLTGWKIPNPPTGEFKDVKEVKNDAGKVTAFVGVLKKDGKEVTLWQVKDGTIVGGGPASHIFTETVADNFHYRVEAKINDKGNSGQYFRTRFEGGFPAGYEAQINATHGDWRRTGSLYPDGRTKLTKSEKEICVKVAPHKPDEYFVQEVVADGPHIQIFVNGKKTVDFTDPDNTYKQGHFALQGHDPGSVMTFKKVEYKPLQK